MISRIWHGYARPDVADAYEALLRAEVITGIEDRSIDGFSEIRDRLLANMVWMASDSTGVPPRFAKKAGFAQVTYGTFTGPSPRSRAWITG